MLIPQLLLILAILSSIFVFFLYFEEIPLKLFKKDIIVAFLVFLNTVGILKILFNIHSYIFLHCSKRIFNIILFASNILHLCYIVLARYYVYITVFEPLILRWSYVFLFTFLLFITYLGLISKFLINTTHIIIMACYTRQPSLLLVDPTDVPPPNTSNNKGTHLSLFSYHQHQHFPPQFPRVSSWVKGGVICTAIGASAACVAVYYYHRSTKAAELSAKAAELSADATCVQAGLMTKEEFHGKWSTTGSSDTMVSPLEIWL
jgi:hypothetical protein